MKQITESDILIACSEAIERAKPEYQAVAMRDILLVKLKEKEENIGNTNHNSSCHEPEFIRGPADSLMPNPHYCKH